jgi:hypothetical protein
MFMSCRFFVLLEESNGGKELSSWIFSVNSVFDGMSLNLDVFLLEV